MSFFSSIRSADRSTLRRDRSVEDPSSQPPDDLEPGFSLPRHLLVSLAGITADVTALQQRCGDAPELEVSLERLLGKLDGLVDSIYEHVADPAAFSLHRSGLAARSPSDALSAVPVGPADARHVARSPGRAGRNLLSHPS
jgi:hypothetical protein